MAKKKNSKAKSKSTKTQSTASPSITKAINTEVIAAALSTVNQPVFMKVCRLCETKDGPFLNIFDSEKITAKKIEEIMPFWVAENDDLPHKICFRCSAKVEELHEFIEKCVRTQESLRKAVGKKEPLPIRTKTRAIWEEQLNKSNMSNDDICDALIKKAMEGIKDLPKPLPAKENDKTRSSTRTTKVVEIKSDVIKQEESVNTENDDDVTLKEIKFNKNYRNSCIRSSRSSNVELVQNEHQSVHNEPKSLQNKKCDTMQEIHSDKSVNKDTNIDNSKLDNTNSTVKRNNTDKNKLESSVNPKPFDIMDHVSMIKVNGVGVLFQCKLCNRNFLKREVVITHGCAKSGVPKIDICNMYVPPDPPKVTTVKYINTRISTNMKTETVGNKSLSDNNSVKTTQVTADVKKKIGPASKIGRRVESSNTSNETVQSLPGSTVKLAIASTKALDSPIIQTPVVNFPALPCLNSRYKLLPGPNNTFTLVEDQTDHNTSETESTAPKPTKNQSSEIIDLDATPEDKNVNQNPKKNNLVKVATRIVYNSNKQKSQTESSTEQQPYPVGLFQTVAHHSSTFNQIPNPNQVPFTTPAMKKQSYTIVQTGNPSKLLISTKPQQVAEEVPKKRLKKTKTVPRNDNSSQEPFSVTLEDTAPAKDPGFFTFINVDPLLQPSYVLPTDNIIQESQITTSTPIANKVTESSKDKDKDKYTCNMCGEKFNREKKLNAHIFSHYNAEEDDHEREKKTPRKRSRK